MGRYAIVINVADAENTCFIAMPFDVSYSPVYDLIVRAANALGLQAVRTSNVQASQSFLRDIQQRVRAARIVVAVCEPAEPVPNPNVMYEIGIAHALGKPTILLTTSLARLPADLAGRYALEYAPDQLVPNSIVELQLQRAMGDLLTRMDRARVSLIDPAEPDVSLAHARHKALLEPGFWDNIQTVLTFAKTVHEKIQSVSTLVDPLLRHVVTILFECSRVGERRVPTARFLDRWTEYHNFFGALIQDEIFARRTTRLAEVDGGFEVMLSHVDPTAREPLQTSKAFYESVKTRLDEYYTHHLATTAMMQDDPGGCINNRGHELHSHIAVLERASKQCILEADRMIVNLIRAMF